MKKALEWYVITGGPNSGKTTAINSLAELGYATVPEYARVYIDGELKKGKTIEEIRKDEIKFQDKIARFKITMDKKAPKNQIVFFDRGLPDSLAYYKFLKATPPKSVLKACKNNYKKIFLLDMVPYRNDYARTESKKKAEKIHGTIKKVYESMGYKVVRIPLAPVEKRVKLILESVG